MVKNSPANAGDVRAVGSVPGSGRPPGGGHGNPLRYSCLENPWTGEPGGLQSTGSLRVGCDEATYHGLARSGTQCLLGPRAAPGLSSLLI